MTRPDNPRFPHYCKITRPEAHDPLKDESEDGEIVVYEGKCRAYDKNTVSDKGDVITSNRGLAVPVTREGWVALGIAPKEGDRVYVDRGSFTEYGTVVDKNPANFGGTHILWKYDR